jgi:large subunit ribosomal protein L25
MKTIFLKGELRDEVGTRTAKVLRAEGKVPCNMYGLVDGNMNFAVYHADFKNLVYTPNVYKVKIELGGKNYDAILQDIQFHPVSDMIIHCDFVAVDETKPVVMEIPVRVVGNAPGVRAGGKLVKKLNRLRVRGLIQDHVASGVKLTCKDTFLNRAQYQQLLYVALSGLPGTEITTYSEVSAF